MERVAHSCYLLDVGHTSLFIEINLDVDLVSLHKFKHSLVFGDTISKLNVDKSHHS